MSTDNNRSNAQALKSALEQQLANETLSDDQLQQLMTMQRSIQSEPRADSVDADTSPPANIAVARVDRQRVFFPALAASLLLLVMGLWWQLPNLSTPGAGYDIARQIAMEVVKNHLKLKPLEVETNSMVEVQRFFNQLDFLPQRSSTLAQRYLLADSAMLGGRYCSIKGVTAAQLRYRAAPEPLSAAVSTLYQVAYDPNLFGTLPDIATGASPLQLSVKGLQVDLWVERGLLLVLVHEG